jgi:hypothetical protein
MASMSEDRKVPRPTNPAWRSGHVKAGERPAGAYELLAEAWQVEARLRTEAEVRAERAEEDRDEVERLRVLVEAEAKDLREKLALTEEGAARIERELLERKRADAKRPHEGWGAGFLGYGYGVDKMFRRALLMGAATGFIFLAALALRGLDDPSSKPLPMPISLPAPAPAWAGYALGDPPAWLGCDIYSYSWDDATGGGTIRFDRARSRCPRCGRDGVKLVAVWAGGARRPDGAWEPVVVEDAACARCIFVEPLTKKK